MKGNRIFDVGESIGAQAQGGTNPPCRILVVDDDLCIRQLSSESLIRAGYEVDVAGDGEAGWRALHAKNYDLLITDNNMPMLSGLELITKLRSEKVTLPVILASGTLPTAELNRHPWLQLAATLPKPFTIDELLETVKKVLPAAESARSRTEDYFPVMQVALGQTEPLARAASMNGRVAFANMIPRHSLASR